MTFDAIAVPGRPGGAGDPGLEGSTASEVGEVKALGRREGLFAHSQVFSAMDALSSHSKVANQSSLLS